MNTDSVQEHIDTNTRQYPVGTRADSSAKRRGTVLCYHELGDGDSGYLYQVSRGQFEAHLGVAHRLQTERPETKIAITFDDGHISNYTMALPSLQVFSSRAVFFVIASRIGRQADFMNWPHLRELLRLGHEIASHSWSHVFLTECSDSQLRMELSRSKATIEDGTGVEVRAISAPHGRWNERVAQACLECGYTRLYTSNPWQRAYARSNLETHGRFVVHRRMTADSILHVATMTRAEAAFRRCLYSARRTGRWIVGDSIYHHLWNKLSGWKGPDDRGETPSARSAE